MEADKSTEKLLLQIGILSNAIEEFDKGNFSKAELLKLLTECKKEIDLLKLENNQKILNELISRLLL